MAKKKSLNYLTLANMDYNTMQVEVIGDNHMPRVIEFAEIQKVVLQKNKTLLIDNFSSIIGQQQEKGYKAKFKAKKDHDYISIYYHNHLIMKDYQVVSIKKEYQHAYKLF